MIFLHKIILTFPFSKLVFNLIKNTIVHVNIFSPYRHLFFMNVDLGVSGY